MAERSLDFSIIVPTRNRPLQLRACLEALASLNYPGDRFEVIVVDDGSRASPDSVFDGVSTAVHGNLIRQAHAGPARARNAGAAQARGRTLAFLDDDCRPAPDWLGRLAAAFREKPGHLVAGRTVNVASRNVCSVAGHILSEAAQGHVDRASGSMAFYASNNIAVPADDFQEVGGFDTSFPRPGGEDREFCLRWVLSGRSQSHAPEAVVFHSHSLKPAALWRQQFNYGRGACLFYRKKITLTTEGERPSLQFLGAFHCKLWRLVRDEPVLRWIPLAVLVFVSQAAVATGYFWETISCPDF